MNEFNVIIKNKYYKENEDLVPILFDEEEVIFIEDDNIDMYDILVKLNIFRSKSEARKNWKKTKKDIPDGFTDIMKIGKLNKRITIYKPVGKCNGTKI